MSDPLERKRKRERGTASARKLEDRSAQLHCSQSPRSQGLLPSAARPEVIRRRQLPVRPASTGASRRSIHRSDPGGVYAIDPNIITAAMCNSLLQFNSQGQLAPELASSWKQSSPTTFVYNLVHNAKFWDGNPVTATDAAYSMNRIASPKLASPLLSLLQTGNIKDATANGKWQVVVHLTKPNPIAQDLPATPIGQVVEKSFVEKYGPRVRHDAGQDNVQRPVQAGLIRQGRPDHPRRGAELLGHGAAAEDQVDHVHHGE